MNLKIAGEILAALPKKKLNPETTKSVKVLCIRCAWKEFVVRDFTRKGLQKNTEILQKIAEKVMKEYPLAKNGFQHR